MSTPQQNGLTRWRERQNLEREWKLQRLAQLRLDATEEVRDGQTFCVVRIPDAYDSVERVEPPVQFRRPRRRVAAA